MYTTLDKSNERVFTLKMDEMFPPTLQWRNLKANQIFSFYTTTGMFENGTATVKTHQLFSVHTTLVEFEDTTIIIGHFAFVFGENSSREISSFSLYNHFPKASFFISVDGRPNLEDKAACLNFCGV